ncbi:histidinol-phosphatase [Fodinisporobacter ferrooxydans]|uniref:Histidinol-phosphatase n=1 Tax=Fodinisporobacter ferrooxydans TaxID=2901836 RepID=A0ABY4CIZ7_9BACL|nr:histidinol-phosphatase [Alicyclobacillaceae bacterium MYW30-H2]
MKFDMHTHHERCGHAAGGIREYVEAAIAAGLTVIGISDHSPYFGEEEDHPKPNVAMAKSEFPLYIREVLQIKDMYKDAIEVLLGIESDFFPDYADIYREVYQKYPFDYIIGSVHVSGGKSIFNRRRWTGLTEEQLIKEKQLYYDLIQRSAKSRMFDILGHIDAMKANYPTFVDIKKDIVDQTLQVIAACDVAIEVNTSGKTKRCGGWYPSDETLERALFYGVKVTFGSDAHDPARVGDEWEIVGKRLKEIGFREWVFYRQRRRQAVSL